jgi:uncharacterized protein YegJ (DUF2314 family)
VFKGVLANEPFDIPGKHLKDPVEVKREDVSDWIIREGNIMLGGYTAKLLMERENKN